MLCNSNSSTLDFLFDGDLVGLGLGVHLGTLAGESIGSVRKTNRISLRGLTTVYFIYHNGNDDD